MKEKYHVFSESGCTRGAIGRHHPVSATVEAENHYDALLEAYEHIEHLRNPAVTCIRTGAVVVGFSALEWHKRTQANSKLDFSGET